jgi:hypothetical protein
MLLVMLVEYVCYYFTQRSQFLFSPAQKATNTRRYGSPESDRTLIC